jgi:hypothetical protein
MIRRLDCSLSNSASEEPFPVQIGGFESNPLNHVHLYLSFAFKDSVNSSDGSFYARK